MMKLHSQKYYQNIVKNQTNKIYYEYTCQYERMSHVWFDTQIELIESKFFFFMLNSDIVLCNGSQHLTLA